MDTLAASAFAWIDAGTRCYVPKWLEDGYLSLCSREEPLTVEEVEWLGPDRAAALERVRASLPDARGDDRRSYIFWRMSRETALRFPRGPRTLVDVAARTPTSALRRHRQPFYTTDGDLMAFDVSKGHFLLFVLTVTSTTAGGKVSLSCANQMAPRWPSFRNDEI